MEDETVVIFHWSFWLINAVMLIWNMMGIINYFFQLDADALASFPEMHRVIIDSRPAWATVGFVIAVFAGTFGCLLLLLRKSSAILIFIVSLLGVIVTIMHTLGYANSGIDFSPFEILMMMLMPLLVVVFLIWYSFMRTINVCSDF